MRTVLVANVFAVIIVAVQSNVNSTKVSFLNDSNAYYSMIIFTLSRSVVLVV